MLVVCITHHGVRRLQTACKSSQTTQLIGGRLDLRQISVGSSTEGTQGTTQNEFGLQVIRRLCFLAHTRKYLCLEPWFAPQVCFGTSLEGFEHKSISKLFVRVRHFRESYNTSWCLRMLRLRLPALGLLVAWLVRFACPRLALFSLTCL